MDYRIDRTPVTRHSSRRVVAVTATVLIAIGAAVGGIAIGGRSDPETDAGASAAGASIGIISTLPVPSPQTRCHDVAVRRCAQIADAALGAVVDPTLPPATTIDVWASLVCGSVFDCPPAHMTDRRPAGSAVIGLANALVLWVNVSEPLDGATPHASDSVLDAWVIRSGPSG